MVAPGHPDIPPSVARVVEAIRRETGANTDAARPEVAVILGSGLSGFETRLSHPIELPYGLIGLPEPTVSGHRGALILGTLRGRRMAVLAGRAHWYEGHEMEEVVRAVRVMTILGAGTLLVSNAAGGLDPRMKPGDLMVLTDHINCMGANPLRGPNIECIGPRFPDMTTAYDPAIRVAFHKAATRMGLPIRDGVYLAVSGPTYETPAEIRAFRSLGADAVGMSTVPEVVAARHAGLRVGAISCITNLGAGLSDSRLSHDDVKAVGASIGVRLADLFEDVLDELPDDTRGTP